MAKYRVTICRSARKELEQLDPIILERIFLKIEALAENPYPPGCLKIQGQKNLWRIRESYNWQAFNDLIRHFNLLKPRIIKRPTQLVMGF
ncbi:hypothetical protein [Candidatus Parabeggiatoa sp. HSG14]|uniref:type II toxin-antitoxin system RelE family toxin n=1 Tax=Candidatus Parabeggiatoa sp. HSG14 TaxID=3055593 RepID=UPI0025A930B2|nr:hypothetical protein [Thiotrichales bacterium HSG14]